MSSRNTSTLGSTCQNLRAPFFIEQMRLNGNHSNPSISSEPLIEDKEPNLTAIPKFSYLYIYSSTKNVFLNVLSKSNCLDNSVLKFLDLFIFSTHFHVRGVFEIKILSKE